MPAIGRDEHFLETVPIDNLTLPFAIETISKWGESMFKFLKSAFSKETAPAVELKAVRPGHGQLLTLLVVH